MVLACAAGGSDEPVQQAVGASTRTAGFEVGPAIDVDTAAGVERTPSSGSPVSAPKEEPIGIRASRGTLVVYVEPAPGSEIRGTIPKQEPFFVHELVTGPDCRNEGWARVDQGGYVCLERAEPSQDPPRVLPVLEDGAIAPFYYARLRRPSTENGPRPARWRHRFALYRGEPTDDELEPRHNYAFVVRKRARVGPVLVDERGRAVKERELRRLKPSAFSGHHIEKLLPSEQRLGWAVTWPFTPVFERPERRAREVGRLRYQQEIVLESARTGKDRDRFRGLVGGGFVRESDVRYFVPAPPPPRQRPGSEIWIDVDLGQRTLAVMRGKEPLFATLVATGSFENPTPRGLFRIGIKQAYGDMRSRPDDHDDDYHVEGVPWAQYFSGRHALHGTYWHNRFGRRTSHGCINLSMRDAAHVYGLTNPRVPPGWVSVRAHEADPGTLVRIRRGREPTRRPRRRSPP
jgi:hypothetical protein